MHPGCKLMQGVVQGSDVSEQQCTYTISVTHIYDFSHACIRFHNHVSSVKIRERQYMRHALLHREPLDRPCNGGRGCICMR